MSENENKTIPNDKIKSYKKPNVPNLRFNDNIWKKYQFSEIYEITNGINKDKESFGYGFPIVNYMDVNKNTFISRELIQGKVNSLPNERVIYSVTPSDILLTRTSETKEEIAYASCLLEPVDNCVFSGFLLRARPKNNENIPIFIAYLLRSKKYRNELMKLSTMTSRALINSDNLGKLQIKIPNKETQIKISKFLTTIDKRITTQSKIINNYESLIKWIRYCIFGKSYTIKNEVKISKLGEFLLEYSKKNTDNNLQAVAVGKYGIRMRDEIYSKNLSSDYSKNKVIEKDSLVIGMGSTQIDIGILSEDKRYCVSPAYTTYKIKGILSKYLNEYLIYLNPLLSKRYMIIGARQGKSVNKDELLQHKLSIHSIEKQKNIILMFEKFYSFIQKEKDILELYKKQKAYLLQNMFI